MELHVSNFRRAIMKNRWITNGPVLRNSRAFNEDIHKGNRRQHYVRDREPLCTDLPGVIHKTCCWLTYIYIPNVELHSNMAPLQKGQSPLTHPTTLTQWRPVTHICVAELDHHCFRYQLHDDVIKWKHFPRYWPFVRGIHRSTVNSPHKGQWRGALMFSLICVWINGWVNSREAGDLRRYRAHYDVTVMCVGSSVLN